MSGPTPVERLVEPIIAVVYALRRIKRRADLGSARSVGSAQRDGTGPPLAEKREIVTESTETTPPPFDWETYEDYAADEADGELGDPSLGGLEAAHDNLRAAWKDWRCRSGSGKYVEVRFYGRSLPVPAPAYDAYKALERALQAAGYPTPQKAWTYVCRHIGDTWEQRRKDGASGNCGSTRSWSLHAYGMAIDIDEDYNKMTKGGDPYEGRIKKHHVDAVLRIKNTAGRTLWEWGGGWDSPVDRMHFQIAQGPGAVAVDWSTVPGAGSEQVPGPAATSVVTPEVEGVTHRVATRTSGLNVRSRPTTSGAIVTNLPKGTPVAAQPDPAQEADNHRWLKIKAGYGGEIIEGWVADDFLERVAEAPVQAEASSAAVPSRDEAAAAAAQGATHRVATKKDDLRMRSQPTTSAGDNIIVELPKGTPVTALSDEVRHSDGHPWLEVRASVGGETYDGWVARDLLEPMG